MQIAITTAMLLLVGIAFASARQWKATPQALAQDYLSINDSHLGDITLVMWFAPEMIPAETPGANAIVPMLRKYVLLIAVHGKLDKATGTLRFDDVTELHPTDQNRKLLTAVPRDVMPPTTAGALAMVETMFRQSAGALGTHMKMFVFEAGSVDSCKKGLLSLPFANETYTWRTPIPGCQSI